MLLSQVALLSEPQSRAKVYGVQARGGEINLSACTYLEFAIANTRDLGDIGLESIGSLSGMAGTIHFEIELDCEVADHGRVSQARGARRAR